MILAVHRGTQAYPLKAVIRMRAGVTVVTGQGVEYVHTPGVGIAVIIGARVAIITGTGISDALSPFTPVVHGTDPSVIARSSPGGIRGHTLSRLGIAGMGSAGGIGGTRHDGGGIDDTVAIDAMETTIAEILIVKIRTVFAYGTFTDPFSCHADPILAGVTDGAGILVVTGTAPGSVHTSHPRVAVIDGALVLIVAVPRLGNLAFPSQADGTHGADQPIVALLAVFQSAALWVALFCHGSFAPAGVGNTRPLPALMIRGTVPAVPAVSGLGAGHASTGLRFAEKFIRTTLGVCTLYRLCLTAEIDAFLVGRAMTVCQAFHTDSYSRMAITG